MKKAGPRVDIASTAIITGDEVSRPSGRKRSRSKDMTAMSWCPAPRFSTVAGGDEQEEGENEEE